MPLIESAPVVPEMLLAELVPIMVLKLVPVESAIKWDG